MLDTVAVYHLISSVTGLKVTTDSKNTALMRVIIHYAFAVIALAIYGGQV